MISAVKTPNSNRISSGSRPVCAEVSATRRLRSSSGYDSLSRYSGSLSKTAVEVALPWVAER